MDAGKPARWSCACLQQIASGLSARADLWSHRRGKKRKRQRKTSSFFFFFPSAFPTPFWFLYMPTAVSVEIALAWAGCVPHAAETMRAEGDGPGELTALEAFSAAPSVLMKDFDTAKNLAQIYVNVYRCWGGGVRVCSALRGVENRSWGGRAGELGLSLLGVSPGSIPQAQAAVGIYALYN